MRNGYREPDGLDEIFLPYDIGRWDGKIGAVENAVIDDEIGAAIDKIIQKGASVWAIFDTCHAGGMTRSLKVADDAPKFRHVSPMDLGGPPEVLRQARKAPGGWKPKSERALLTKNRNNDDALIAFYASQPDEPSAEETLPSFSGGSEKKRLGLFTYYLAQAMQNGEKDSFKMLADRIGAHYRQDKRPFPTPLFTGGLEQVPNFK